MLRHLTSGLQLNTVWTPRPALTPTNIVLYSYCYDLITSISQNNCRVSNKNSRLYFRGEVLIPQFPSSPRSHWSHLPSSVFTPASGLWLPTSQCKSIHRRIRICAGIYLVISPRISQQLSESYRKHGQIRLWCKLWPSSKFNWIWQEIEYTQSTKQIYHFVRNSIQYKSRFQKVNQKWSRRVEICFRVSLHSPLLIMSLWRGQIRE